MIYVNRRLFTDELFTACRAFMATLFDVYASVDADAPLCAQIATVLGDRRNLAWWQETMTGCFSDTNPSTIGEVPAAYDTWASGSALTCT